MTVFKIVFTVVCFIGIASLPASSQQAAWDSTYRPNNFSLKVGLFKSFPNAISDIVFLGNSITAGTDWNEQLGIRNARNRGISGDITFGVIERLQEVTEGRPAKVFVLIGINDISRNIPDIVILNNYRTIVSTIRRQSPQTKIYFHTLMPVNSDFTQFKNHYNKDQHILWVNEQLRLLGITEKFTVIDLYPKFLDADKKLDKKYTEDGLHLNAAGYALWTSILKQGGYLN
ncbi:sialate O-acetylesterase [Segetibacter sp. 3557_3]|uniref:GDSL-type esterase/lipase family protein n=1 Tax=Segetibacter sp. 3557_3 TaxID=2547429 RepID=UPI0010588112|nr:GDSL-type esterase/lipase family protein [Segetibacter sp. 3557_3]TDH28666.1 sialate O-acetylesterase [Segetibacter sp. 3557_3]